MVEFIIGDYRPTSKEIVIDNYTPACIFSNKLGDNSPVVIYGEFAGLTADDCKSIAKAATKDVKIVLQSNKLIKGIRQGKNVRVIFDGGSANTSIFEVATAVIKLTDRDYVHGFLKANKPQMYMLVKCLIAGFDKITKANQQIIAWLDMHQWKVNPEILYLVMAYKIKAQPNLFRLPWKFPKKKDSEKE